MSKMGELAMEIEELYSQGFSAVSIAAMLNAPLDLVEDFFNRAEDEYIDPEEWDSAFADGEALASAGFGTDEDYGSF